MYPVNGVSFNTREKDYFATAGGDGFLTFWDYDVKNKIKNFEYKDVPVNCLRMRDDGSVLAYSLGYDWSEGIYGIGKYKPRVYVHVVGPDELKYKKI